MARRPGDILDRMLSADAITPEMADAGVRFRRAFDAAALDVTACSCPDAIRTAQHDTARLRRFEATVAGRNSVRAAVDALGGPGSPVVAVVVQTLGEDRPLAAVARRQRMDRHTATGLLISALAVLAGRSCRG